MRRSPLLVVAVLAALTGGTTPAAADPSTTIIGGVNATEAYPFSVSMQNRSGDHFCGAALVQLTSPVSHLDTSVLPDSRCGTGTVELCVGNVDGWRGACYGDSGGPAVIRVGGVWRLAGTTSGGISPICGQGPSIYVDSSTHRSWIDSVAGDDVVTTYTVNASSEVANGGWRFQVQDTAGGDVGRIDLWSLQF